MIWMRLSRRLRFIPDRTTPLGGLAGKETGQAMITEVSFRNFKALRDLTTTLGRFTVFVGPNASGKTSVLQGLHLFCDLVGNATSHDHTSSRVKVIRTLTNRKSKGEVELICKDEARRIRWRDSKDHPDQSHRVHIEHITSPGMGQYHNFPDLPSIPISLLLRLDVNNLARPSYTTATIPKLGPEGQHLHTTLAYLYLSDQSRFQALQTTFTSLIPSVRRISFERTTINQLEYIQIPENGTLRKIQNEVAHTTEQLKFETVGGVIPAYHASEGTLFVLGILTVLYGPEAPQLLLLDDIDKGLHPKAQLELVGVLKELLKAQPQLQILATTHSPYILDRLSSDEVRLMYLQEDGTAVCGRMEEHPEFARWKEEMTPGEFWMMFGEKWLVERKDAGVEANAG